VVRGVEEQTQQEFWGGGAGGGGVRGRPWVCSTAARVLRLVSPSRLDVSM